MERRTFLRSAGGGASALVGLSAPASASSLQLSDIPIQFFDSLVSLSENRREPALIQCADALCADEYISTKTTEEIGTDLASLNDQIRRVRFGVEMLNEYGITTAIDSSMVLSAEQSVRSKTRYVPLVGSFNNLQRKSCQLNQTRTKNNARDFLFACIAFGLEVGMWQAQIPYKLAWRGTRFVSNKTFLRYARESCRRCIALVMSEIHWALRALPYNISKIKGDFVHDEIQRLNDKAGELGQAINSIDLNRTEINSVLNQPGGAVGITSSGEQGISDENKQHLFLVSLPVASYYVAKKLKLI
jgi:hypothetical protein